MIQMDKCAKPLHINASKDEIANIVLMPGDPLRAKYIAEQHLDNFKEVTNIRNNLGYTGYYKGKKVSIISSGMGIPSMSIYSMELFHFFDVQKIIRIGTCGVLSPDIDVPEIILADKCFSESNYAYTLDDSNSHIAYPSKELNMNILKAADENNFYVNIGNTVTMEMFGPYIDRKRVYNRVPNELHLVAEEMEAYALFTNAKLFNRQAACILTSTDSDFKDIVLTPEQREKNLDDMAVLALDAIIK